jgi:nitrite reductase/ring-hydroxylating ferredoxin subunit
VTREDPIDDGSERASASVAVAPSRYVVARAEDIAEGERLIVEVGGREIGVFNVGGDYHAFLNRCPHLGGPLCQGDVVGLLESDGPGSMRIDSSRKFLMCPWHGWEFDMQTGESWWDPRRMRARRYPVGVERNCASAEQAAGVEQTAGADQPSPEQAADIDPSAPAERIRGAHVAERLPVGVVEGDIVVTMRAASPDAPTTYPATGRWPQLREHPVERISR